MPVIFSSSLLALPSSLARYANVPALESAAVALSPSGALYLPANVALIVAFNYLYTFLQLDPKDLSEQLKRQGASIPGVRPGRATAEFITKTLDRMSVLGEAGLARAGWGGGPGAQAGGGRGGGAGWGACPVRACPRRRRAAGQACLSPFIACAHCAASSPFTPMRLSRPPSPPPRCHQARCSWARWRRRLRWWRA